MVLSNHNLLDTSLQCDLQRSLPGENDKQRKSIWLSALCWSWLHRFQPHENGICIMSRAAGIKV
jgi:hypothetical protein